MNKKEFDIKKITPDLRKIVIACDKISENAILYLPKNLNPLDVYTLIIESGVSFKKIEFQVYYIGKNVKGIGCFLGNLVRPCKQDVKNLYKL